MANTLRRFAEDTKVPVSRTRDQIVELMRKAGADAFIFGEDATRATIGFRLEGRYLRFTVPIPAAGRNITTGRSRNPAMRDQIIRTRWRALLLVIKAKLEAVAIGLVTAEEAFLADILLPDKRTVAEVMVPQIESAYRDGTMPPLLPYYGEQQ